MMKCTVFRLLTAVLTGQRKDQYKSLIYVIIIKKKTVKVNCYIEGYVNTVWFGLCVFFLCMMACMYTLHGVELA